MKNKKKIILIASVVVGTILIVALIILLASAFSNKKYDTFSANIKVDLIKDESTDTHYVSIRDDGTKAEVMLSYFDRPIYITKNKMSFEYGGRFKVGNNKSGYRNFYKLVNSIELGEEISRDEKSVMYNPKVDNETLNEILTSINFGKEVEGDANALIVVREGKIREFSFFLDNVDGYKEVSIVAVLEDYDDSYEITPVKVYKEISDEVIADDFSIVKGHLEYSSIEESNNSSEK